MSTEYPESAKAIPVEVLESIGDVVVTFDPQGQLNACSPAAIALLGLGRSERRGVNIVDILTTAEGPVDIPLLCNAEQTLQLNVLDCEQRWIPMEVAITPMQRGGMQWYVALLRQDVAHAEFSPELNSFSKLISRTFDQVEDAIVILSPDGELNYVNASARQWIFEDAETMKGWASGKLASTIEDEFGEPIFDFFEFIQKKLALGQMVFKATVTNRFGTERRVSAQLIAQYPENYGFGQVVLVLKDITRAFEFSHLLSYQATHDALTGCYNRKALESEIRAFLLTGSEQEPGTLSLLRFDQLDLIINDCGYAAETEVLCQLKALIQPYVTDTDLLARLRAGEFGLIFHNSLPEQTQAVIEDLVEQVRKYRFQYQGVDYGVGVNAGIVPIIPNSDSLDGVMMSASSSLQLAQEQGRNQVCRYGSKSEAEGQLSDRGWLVKIQSALDADRLRVFCQQISPLGANGEHHYEILVRMVSEEGELIPPDDFIGAAERYGWIRDIEYWVIEETCLLLQLLAAKSPGDRWHFFINLSGSSIGDKKLEEFIAEQLMRLKDTGSRLSFEITETSAITDFEKAAQFMWNLKAVGCTFSLDDFGSGLSSFSYLQRLPVDYIKIDGEFIRDIAGNKMHQVIVESIVHIARKANMKTIAEYVQTQEVLDLLSDIGLDYAQGSAIGMPRPLKSLLSGTAN
ncbi:MAG: EAL domain-containing protein [Pseudomonadales bacterium]|nr:EAL domain-containing protein [Pseudomonadales bacterium]